MLQRFSYQGDGGSPPTSQPYHFYFNFVLFVHIGHANFDFNWCSIFTECCFWFWKRFKWSKSILLLSFPPPYQLNSFSKIFNSLPLMKEGNWKSAILEIPGQWHAGTCIESVMVLVQSTQHNFPFRFQFWYIDMSWYRLLLPLVASSLPISYKRCPPLWETLLIELGNHKQKDKPSQ